MLYPLHDNKKLGCLRVIGLMSGKGSNLRAVIEHERYLKVKYDKEIYKVVAIFSDNSRSNAIDLGKEFSVPVLTHDIRSFYTKRNKPLSDMKVRREYDEENVKMLSVFQAKLAVYAGYMSIATQPLVDAFIGINVHPSDLSILDENGKRKYVGSRAVYDQIICNETHLRSSVHLVSYSIDQGEILMISPPMRIKNIMKCSTYGTVSHTKRVEYNQQHLKKFADWKILPKTIEYIAMGRYSRDWYNDKLHFDNELIPNGVKLDR